MIFISHSDADLALAQRVAESLKKEGLDVWEDSVILPGDNWADEYAKALRNSDAMVVLLTPHSIKSKKVSSNLGFALGQINFKNRVVPVIAASPEELPREEIRWILKKFPMIDLQIYRHEEEGFNDIVELLKNQSYPAY